MRPASARRILDAPDGRRRDRPPACRLRHLRANLRALPHELVAVGMRCGGRGSLRLQQREALAQELKRRRCAAGNTANLPAGGITGEVWLYPAGGCTLPRCKRQPAPGRARRAQCIRGDEGSFGTGSTTSRAPGRALPPQPRRLHGPGRPRPRDVRAPPAGRLRNCDSAGLAGASDRGRGRP